MAASEWIAIVSIALTLLLTLGGAGTAAYVKVVARLTRIETNQIWDRKVSKRMEKFLDMLAARGPKRAVTEHDSDDPGEETNGGEEAW
jgi:hypothetical protein